MDRAKLVQAILAFLLVGGAAFVQIADFPLDGPLRDALIAAAAWLSPRPSDVADKVKGKKEG